MSFSIFSRFFKPLDEQPYIVQGPASSSQTDDESPLSPEEQPEFHAHQHEKSQLQANLGTLPTKIAARIGANADRAVGAPVGNMVRATANFMMPSRSSFDLNAWTAVQVGASILTRLAAPVAERAATSAVRNFVVDAEMSALQIADRVQTVLTRTSPQELGEPLHLLTDFLNVYHAAFAQLSNQQFASRQEEDAAWMAAMGDSWHPLINPENQTAELKHQAFAEFIRQTVERIETIILADNRHIAPAIPGAQELGVKYLNRFMNNKIAENAELSQQFLIELSDRQQAFNTLRNYLNQAIDSLRTFDYQIPRTQISLTQDTLVFACSEQATAAGIIPGMDMQSAHDLWILNYPDNVTDFEASVTSTTPPDHHILAETVTSTRKIVFYCSPLAAERGVRVGMDATQAGNLWNANKAEAEPEAVIVDEDAINQPADEGATPLSYRGHQPLKTLLQSTITTVLTQSPGIARDRACEKLSRLPYIGRALSGMFRAIFWMTAVGIRGTNRFIGIPSAEVLAEEITTNLFRHLYNPAILSAPLFVVERLLNILEGNDVTGHGNAEAPREAFLGELTLALSTIFTSLCPSIFNRTYPRWAVACTNIALWMMRRSIAIGALALTNSLTKKIALYAVRRFSAPEKRDRNLILADMAITWVNSSARALFSARDALQTTHSILSSAYRNLGELGLVSREQTHFERGSQSLPQLIHQTMIAAARIVIPQQIPERFNANMNYKVLLKKLDRNEMPSEEEIQTFREKIVEKINSLVQDRALTTEKLELIGNLPNLLENTTDSSSLNSTIASKVERGLTAWKALRGNIAADIAEQERTKGSAYSEFLNIFEKINAVITTLEMLQNENKSANSFLTTTYEREERLNGLISTLAIAASEQNHLKFELESLFQSQQTAMNARIELHTQEVVNVATVAGLRAYIQAELHQNDIAAFAHPRQAEEARLLEEIRLLDEAITDSKRGEAAAVSAFLTNEAKQQALRGEHEAFLTANRITREFRELQLNEEIDLYLPGELRNFRRRQAELAAQKIELRKQLDKLAVSPLYMDPAWILPQTGLELVETAKRTLPLEPAVEYVDGFFPNPIA